MQPLVVTNHITQKTQALRDSHHGDMDPISFSMERGDQVHDFLDITAGGFDHDVDMPVYTPVAGHDKPLPRIDACSSGCQRGHCAEKGGVIGV